ncbi:hypothetical protein OED01_12290 [Microbacterium sp. M28]|uniref:hypothetical protein n=1 Tax=Microbacterium sp. M28 TaxID=2962064 RepID=UPI0021F3FD1D|nr:hypothetical protein [Microbacterium sp. M28]UYO96376.1 hypothetical protein OED01_12290 [Microbacterium sp. M28]
MIDPFCGAGTVLVEAQHLGISASGIEQNPLGALASRVKTTPLDTQSFLAVCSSILETAKRTRRHLEPSMYVKKWYSAEAYSALCRLSSAAAGSSGAQADAIALVLALTAKRVANTDRRIHVPVKPREPVARLARDVWETWTKEASKLAHKLDRLDPQALRVQVTLGDSREAEPWLRSQQGGRALVFTSPPYGAAQKYIRSSSLELGWLGFAADRGTVALEHNSIGREHLAPTDAKVTGLERHPRIANVVEAARLSSPSRGAIYATYFSDMERVIGQIEQRAARVVFISGTNTVAGVEIDTYDLLGGMLEESGFRRTLSLRDEIKGRMLLTKRRSNAMPSHAEYIEIFEREA